jgi:hypothetical protein
MNGGRAVQRIATQYRKPLAVVIVASTVSLLLYAWLSSQEAVPLSVPISLAPGRFESPPFKPRASQGCEVALSFRSSIPLDELNCLIGMGSMSMKPCSDSQSNVLDVSWRVLSHGESVASGTFKGGNSGVSSGLVETYMGLLDGEFGREYVVELNVVKDGSYLDRTNPRLVVEPARNDVVPSELLGGLLMFLGSSSR